VEEIVFPIFVTLFFLLLSGFFSATETALTSLSNVKTKHLRESHGRVGNVLDLWIDSPHSVLAAILIGNTMVNVFVSIYLDHVSARVFGAKQNPLVVSLVMTVLIVLFGEILPKTFAKNNATTMAIPLLFVFRVFYWFLIPLTTLSTWFLRGVTFLLIRRELKADPQITEEEIEFLINVGEEEGVLEDSKHGMLSGVFELGDTIVREIMVHRIDMTALPITASITEAADVFRDSGLSRIPVYDERIDNIVGIVHSKDVLFFIKKHREDPIYWDSRIGEIKREAFFVPESKPVDQLFQELRRHRQHMGIVLDEYGGTSGLVTMEDIFEEIVGEVRDEFDNEEDAIRPTQVANQYLVECKIHIDDFCEFFDLEIGALVEGNQAGEYDTLGGLILYHFGQIPKIGDKLSVGRMSLEIVEVSKRRVRRALARLIDDASVVI
jgi:putative hemolysin